MPYPTFISDVSSKYGAPMGRRTGPFYIDTSEKVYLRRIRVNAGGYDDGGAYWGQGLPLYEALNDSGGFIFRAADREAAKAHVRNHFPDAEFFK